MQTRYYTLSRTCLSLVLGAFSSLVADNNYTPGEVYPEMPIEVIGTDNNCCRTGVWLPEDPVLFRPFVADPREICYSVGWRLNDQVLVKNVIDVSFGDSIAFYRWLNVGPWQGQLQVELEGALWAVFDPLHESSPLMNADYYVGVPITYAVGPWSFRLRGYHISSHIGDEFLLNHPHFRRKNPSAEYLDFFASLYLTEEIRLYGGVGYVAHMDESFPIGRFYAAGGAELHMSQLGFIDYLDQVYGRPYYGMHFHYQTRHRQHIDQTYVLGYEWGKLCGLQRILRAFIEYHSGYSWEGQFFNCATDYFAIRMSYGF